MSVLVLPRNPKISYSLSMITFPYASSLCLLVSPFCLPTCFRYHLSLYSLATMVCYFSCVGQVTSVSSGSGVRVAEVLMSEGTVGGLGEDRSFQVYFWPGLGTELLANKCYLLRGTVILQETPESEMPRVRSSTVASRLPLTSLLCATVPTHFVPTALPREPAPAYLIHRDDCSCKCLGGHHTDRWL